MLLLAKSKCGHDKGKTYVVYAADEEDGYLALVDGESRSVENPKKKKMKHVQPITHLDEKLVKMYEEAGQIDDQLIRKILKQYLGGNKGIV
jgi:ribosomal protein L14E/L6E/L27E